MIRTNFYEHKHFISCDNCDKEKEITEKGVKRWFALTKLPIITSLTDLEKLGDFHFCSIDCLSKFIEDRENNKEEYI